MKTQMTDNGYVQWLRGFTLFAIDNNASVNQIDHSDVLHLFYVEKKPFAEALTEYEEFTRRYVAIKEAGNFGMDTASGVKPFELLKNLEIIQLNTVDGHLQATLSYQDTTHLLDGNDGYGHMTIPVSIRGLQLSAHGNVLVHQSFRDPSMDESNARSH